VIVPLLSVVDQLHTGNNRKVTVVRIQKYLFIYCSSFRVVVLSKINKKTVSFFMKILRLLRFGRVAEYIFLYLIMQIGNIYGK